MGERSGYAKSHRNHSAPGADLGGEKLGKNVCKPFHPLIHYDPIIQNINSALFTEKELVVEILRLDLIHPEVSGNKWFKLKYNLEEAKKKGVDTVLTFGGAFSNHIYATAAACKLAGLKSIGVIRGEESAPLNPTLSAASEMGMRLHFISREEYRLRAKEDFIESLKKEFGNFHLVPEGGNNDLGIKGCSEILRETMDHDYVFCACGTSATYQGLLRSIKTPRQLIGISVLKGEQREGLNVDYHAGGYAKHNSELLKFKENFEVAFNIGLDYVYTVKLFYGVFDLISKNKMRANSKVLIIHSGGLQGNKGYEERYNLKPKR
jgi:1-aminocyclopropane-1-carboxylate deaminase